MPRALLLLLFLTSPALASVPNFPPLTGRVVDDANILSPATRGELTAMLQRHEQATGEQVVLVTLPSLQGFSIEDFGYQLGRVWGIGQKDKNTGALLIVAPKEHKVRIEVGYGLESKLTDAQSSVIINRDILPQFRRGDFNAGVLIGTAKILKLLSGDTTAAGPDLESEGPTTNWQNSPWVFLLPFVLWMIVIAVWNCTARSTHVIRRVGRSDYFGVPIDFRAGGHFGRGFSGGGFSGRGGFSGGGGSFGGGGASGGW